MFKPRIVLGLLLLCLVIPLHIYVIGDWMGTGVQFALFRYQQVAMGQGIITILQDIGYVTSGVYHGRTAASILLWAGAAAVLVGAAAWTAFNIVKNEGEGPMHQRIAGILMLAAGLLVRGSAIAQYGVLLSGPAGISIPIGAPFLVCLGWWLYRESGRPTDELS
ncbi:MAG: hypothetical protein EHJ95_02285 [Methanobacteriota archaeon]|nr:MAG: hypothetical protein EHJ95_02285 [Euryarchaeota archaeon]